MRSVAYVHGPERIHEMARAFAAGAEANGVPCRIRDVLTPKECGAKVVWVYGLGPAMPAFNTHPKALRIVGDVGYFSEQAIRPRFHRISLNAQQPDAHLRLKPHSAERWERLNIGVEPVKRRGDYILLCGMGPKQATRQGFEYGQWEREQFNRVRAVTDRPILVREKPKNPPIDGVPRSSHATTGEALRSAWAVVCKTGNIGVDAILHGVPVIAEAGPGSIYYTERLEDIEQIQPISPDVRIAALSDISYWQWTLEEMRAGQLWRHLKNEGFI